MRKVLLLLALVALVTGSTVVARENLGAITAGTLNAVTITGGSISGTTISGGSLSGTTISGGSLDIGSGTFTVSSGGILEFYGGVAHNGFAVQGGSSYILNADTQVHFSNAAFLGSGQGFVCLDDGEFLYRLNSTCDGSVEKLASVQKVTDTRVAALEQEVASLRALVERLLAGSSTPASQR